MKRQSGVLSKDDRKCICKLHELGLKLTRVAWLLDHMSEQTQKDSHPNSWWMHYFRELDEVLVSITYNGERLNANPPS